MMLVTELLADNLYDYQRYTTEQGEDCFTVERCARIGWQICEALAFVHRCHLVHCDLKPENVMFVSHSRCIVKVIDFGSSCFHWDRLSTYVQSRSYRAPEVCLGALPYDGRIDVWSLGCMVFEMFTGVVLFQANSIAEMVARMVASVGPLPKSFLLRCAHADCAITCDGVFYSSAEGECNDQRFELFEADAKPLKDAANGNPKAEDVIILHLPRAHPMNRLAPREARSEGALWCPDSYAESGRIEQHLKASGAEGLADPQSPARLLLDFIYACLIVDPLDRPTAAELLDHPFLTTTR
jgi:serine/threonine protein kinase